MSDTRKIGHLFRIVLALGIYTSCATSGPVETTPDDEPLEIVSAPIEFFSPLDELERVQKQVTTLESRLPRKMSFRDSRWKEYVDWSQAWDEMESEQSEIESELAQTGEIQLQPGKSYSLDLESYCVWPGKEHPVTGDGLQIKPLRGPAEKWIFGILDQQGIKSILQERLQFLIWALLTDVRFDELSDDNQKLLLEFYPDASFRFGSRRLENLGKSILKNLLPSETADALENFSSFRQEVLSYQSNYLELERILAPEPTRKVSIPVGWMKVPDGYFLRITSDSYTHVRVDLYVPKEDLGRSPQAEKKRKVFHPSRWVGLPTQGQRLAISPRVISRDTKRRTKTECEKLRKWKPTSCQAMTSRDREKIVKLADPKNFPNTWYQSPPKPGFSVQQRVDCSNFVKHIFEQAGFNYAYAPTRSFRCLNVFEEISADSEKPGDLVLYQTHIGIIDQTGKVISATRGGPMHLSFLKKDKDPVGTPKLSAIQSLHRNQVVPHQPWTILRWRCP